MAGKGLVEFEGIVGYALDDAADGSGGGGDEAGDWLLGFWVGVVIWGTVSRGRGY